jgi:hypothetical protein
MNSMLKSAETGWQASTRTPLSEAEATEGAWGVRESRKNSGIIICSNLR